MYNQSSFKGNVETVIQSCISNEVKNMSTDKKFTAKEAAIAVLKKAEEVLLKAEKTKHDRCVEHVKENSPDIKNPHAVCVAQGVEPEAWGKSEDSSKENEIGTKFEKMEGPDNKIENQPAPQNNPDEKKENNNPPWGTDPSIKGHVKLAKFIGHIDARKALKKGAK